MKTLVIHPQDNSTDMLTIIYAGRDWDVITDQSISKEDLKKAIEEHDRIIMLGHGTPSGLMNTKYGGYIIDDSFADLLKTKDTFSIWCNSDAYFKKHGFNKKELHTGMIISEVGEAYCCLGMCPFTADEMYSNMVEFAVYFRECIDKTPQEMVDYLLEHYDHDDPVTQFNRERIVLV